MPDPSYTQMPVVFLLGPTASGKTDIGMLLSRHVDCHLISVDSSLVYRGLDIGTAKPSQKELLEAPHALVNICDPWDSYSAAQFCIDATREIALARDKHRVPVLLGGTMLYFNALEHGIAKMPAADPAIRQAITQKANDSSWEQIHRELEKVDPVAASRIHPNDPQRIQRALEVWQITGRQISEIQASGTSPDIGPILKFGLYPEDRKALHRRIEKRFQLMLKSNFLDEVKGLLDDSRINSTMPSMRAVGYRQAIEHLRGDYDAAEFEQRGIAATRQLAKRQLTWMRGMADLTLIDSAQFDAPSVVELIVKALPSFTTQGNQ